MDPLEQLGFALAGYGCTTCIGNSGPLDEPVAKADRGQRPRRRGGPLGQPQLRGPDPSPRPGQLPRLAAARRRVRARRTGRHRPDHRAARHRIGRTAGLAQPTSGRRPRRSARSSAARSTRSCSARTYAVVFDGDDRWRALPIPAGDRYDWDARVDVHRQAAVLRRPRRGAGSGHRHRRRPGARRPRRLGHDRPHLAGRLDRGLVAGRASGSRSATSAPLEFNSYGARRGHHEVMMRGTFANIRLRNALAPGKEGPYTVHLPDGEEQFIYDAAMRYQREGTPLVVIAGREYGSGSSRDWAAKGTMLLGVRAVIAESYERIHRSNLVGMGVLPLQFLPGESASSLGLTGRERYAIHGLAEDLTPRQAADRRRRRPTRPTAAAERRFDGDRPPRRPDRRRLLPARRDPAGGPATDRRVERERVGFLNDGAPRRVSMSSAVGPTDGMPEEPTTDTTTDSEPAPDLAAAPSDLTTRSTRHLRDDLLEAVGRAVVGAEEPVRLILTALLADGHVLVEDVPGPARRCSPGRSPGPWPSDEPDPGHAGPPPGRRHRIQPVRGRLAPVRPGPGLHEHPARRRDQPGDAADPGGAARGDAGAAGLDRGRDAPAARAVRRPRDAEPDRVRGHLRPPPGAAGPVPRPDPARLPGRGGRALDRPPLPGRRRAARPDRAGRRRPAAARPPRRGPAGPRRRRGRGVSRLARPGHPPPPGHPARGEPAGDGRALPRRPGDGAPRGPRRSSCPTT